MAKKKRLLTDEEKRINRLRKKFENDPHSEELWQEWHDARETFYKTPDGTAAYHEFAVGLMEEAKNFSPQGDSAYNDGYDKAKGYLYNSMLLRELVATKDKVRS